LTRLAVAALALAARSNEATNPAASTEPADNFRHLFIADNASGAVRAFNLGDLSRTGEMAGVEASSYFNPTGSGRFVISHQSGAIRVDVIDAGVFEAAPGAATRRAPSILETFRAVGAGSRHCQRQYVRGLFWRHGHDTGV
jgi:hypothetical protein